MSTIQEKMEQARNAEVARLAEENRLAQIAAELFGSDPGQELLAHLCKRFDVLGRTFIATGDRGDVNALRAAARDGERAAVNHLLRLCRRGDPKFILPLSP